MTFSSNKFTIGLIFIAIISLSIITLKDLPKERTKENSVEQKQNYQLPLSKDKAEEGIESVPLKTKVNLLPVEEVQAEQGDSKSSDSEIKIPEATNKSPENVGGPTSLSGGIVSLYNDSIIIDYNTNKITASITKSDFPNWNTKFIPTMGAGKYKDLFGNWVGRGSAWGPIDQGQLYHDIHDDDDAIWDHAYQPFNNKYQGKNWAEVVRDMSNQSNISGDTLSITLDVPAQYRSTVDPQTGQLMIPNPWWIPHINAMTNLCLPIPGDSWWAEDCSCQCWQSACAYGLPCQFCHKIINHDMEAVHTNTETDQWNFNTQGCHWHPKQELNPDSPGSEKPREYRHPTRYPTDPWFESDELTIF